jgi:hypothetical protein
VAAVPLLAACGSTHTGDGASASCAARIVLRGHTYLGHSELQRDPATTGRRVTGVLPACDDTGGQDAAETDELVQVTELVDVPLSVGFRWDDTVYVRQGRELPPATATWFRPPRCLSVTDVRLVGDWLRVLGRHEPRFDGDVRPPYRLEVRVTDGPPEYVGATITVHADAGTDPALGPADVRRSLWKGGQVIARVTCRAGRFQALSLLTPSHE